MKNGGRYRPSAGRLIVELFYGDDNVIRENGRITLDVSGMARKLHVRPVRLVETLEWMKRYGILSELSFDRKNAYIRIKQPEWTKRRKWDDSSQ